MAPDVNTWLIDRFDEMEKRLHNRIDRLEEQLDALRTWRAYLAGGGAVVGALLGGGGVAWILQLLS